MSRAAVELQPGDVIGIPYRGVRHEGMVTVAGTEDTATVAHSSKRRRAVVEETAATFRDGRALELIARAPYPLASVGYARSTMGRPWGPVQNCQAWTREVSGLSIPSRDANRGAWTVAAAVAVAALVSARRRGRVRVR